MSKATESLAAQLAPDSKTPRAEQYRIAWNLLLKLPDADEWHRSQAKCWLTYRAFDGDVTLKDWQDKVAPIHPAPTAWMKVRWDMSQTTAEAYLWLRRGDEKQRLVHGIEQAERALDMESSIAEYPPTVLNWLRVTAILAVRKWSLKCDGEAETLILRAVDRWRATMSSFPWQKHPLRFAEMDGDAYVLTMLMFLAQKLGLVSFPPMDWTSPQKIAQKFKWQPWIICLARVQTPERRLV